MKSNTSRILWSGGSRAQAKVTKNEKVSSHTSGLTSSEAKQSLHHMLAKTADCCFFQVTSKYFQA